MNAKRIWRRTESACQRRLAKWFCRRPFELSLDRPIISFTFDDFPRSAFVTGGQILEQAGLSATYYVALGLAGKSTETGEMFQSEDLPELLERGHELGCHTYQHCPAWETEPAIYEVAIKHNREALKDHAPHARFSSHSYPISYPRPETKRRARQYFGGCRGCGQTFNAGVTDLNYLKAFFLEQSRDDLDGIKTVIDANAQARGWLIFATHDIADRPTRFGCTPSLFTSVVEHALRSGAEVLPVSTALMRMGATPASRQTVSI
jgi:peptidoglycan/xylan/chitin deacetylase (PgdA/CDA1 family)